MIININCNSMRYGIYIGFKLARLEFIWDSEFEFAQNVFTSSKEELLAQLPLLDMSINETNYMTFSQSILGYYFRTNADIYYSILIGISIQRSWLIGVSNNVDHNTEIKKLAKSALNSIPKRIVSDIEELFSFILKNKSNDLFEFINKLEQFCEDKDHDNNIKNVLNEAKKATLFLSYSQKDTPIADIIEKNIKNITNGAIEISRYTKLAYKDSFKHFMNTIQEHDFVLCIVSGNYLKSQACMYEVGEIVKDHNFQKKLFFVVLCSNDIKYYPNKECDFLAANIYGNAMNRLEYLKYWENKYTELHNELQKIDSIEAIGGLSRELYEIGKIYKNDINTFLEYLTQHNGKSFEYLYTSNFKDIIEMVISKQ